MVNRKTSLTYVGLVLIIASLVVLAPTLQTWIGNPEQTYFGVFVFTGEDVLWHSGQLTLTYEDGRFEILDVKWPSPRIGDDGEDLGYITYVRASQNFTSPEHWEIEYYCTGLDLTIGPLSFISTDQVLYSDLSGQKIELWIGQHSQ